MEIELSWPLIQSSRPVLGNPNRNTDTEASVSFPGWRYSASCHTLLAGSVSPVTPWERTLLSVPLPLAVSDSRPSS